MPEAPVRLVERFRAIREAKGLSAQEVESRAGLAASYVCEVENGTIVPTLHVWESIAAALEIPLAKLFYDGEGLPELPNLPGRKTADDIATASNSDWFKKNRTRPLSKSDNHSR
jgi:transcriptional regulator with XRE-family HTH domain